MNHETMKLLIPVDGSETSEAILPALRPLTGSHRIESVLFQVLNSPDEEEKVASRLRALRDSLKAEGIAPRVHTVSGDPAVRIVETAAHGGFDLIAMGTHGRKGLDRIRMGSVAEEVVRTSRVPVLLARPDVRVGSWDTILVALDGSPGAEEVLGDVAQLALAVRADVHLVRVNLSLMMVNSYRGVTFESAKADTLGYLNGVADQLRDQGISVTAENFEGRPGVEIPLAAKSVGAGLICMTTHGRPEEVPGLGRSVAFDVIRNAPCPVYVRHIVSAG
jgi:nucleotide-binding universal stress UspA family protein